MGPCYNVVKTSGGAGRKSVITSGKVIDDIFEIVGNKIKLKDTYAFDPVDDTIKTTTGKGSDNIWTKGNNLNAINFVSYKTAEDLAAGKNFSIMSSIDVTTFFNNIAPKPLTYYSGSPWKNINLHASDDKINALLPENKAVVFLNIPRFSKISALLFLTSALSASDKFSSSSNLYGFFSFG